MNIKNLLKISSLLLISLFLFGCTPYNTNTTETIDQTTQQEENITTSPKEKRYVSGILKSIDGGKNWEEKTYVDRDDKNNIITIGDSFVYDIETSPLDDKILVASTKNNGLYISYNQGEQWQSLFSEIGKDVKNYSFSMSSPRTFYVAHRNKVYKTINGGIDWNVIYIDRDADIKKVYNDPQQNNNIYIFTSDGRMIQQNESGSLVLHNFNNGSTGYGKNVGIKDVFFYENTAENNYILFNDNSLFRTNDSGETYTKVDVAPKGIINNLYLYPNNPGSFLLSTATGLFKTNSNGDTWDEMTLLSVDKNINTLTISKKNRNIIYYSMGNLLYKTINDGYNWEVIEMPTNKIISSININPQNNQVLFIGIDITALSQKSADTNLACELLGLLFPIFCQ